ncbi:MAG TPA: hypothetical protein VHN82_03650 [Methanoregula sp.]|nr:hypothetical protein [Methanoregula sp.]
MKRILLYRIALFLLVCMIAILVPVSALQSSEQPVSDSLTRGSRFTITITGVPNTPYYVWLTGTFTMTGEPYDQPPVIVDGQSSITKDPSGGPYTIGSYRYNNGGGRTILDDVAPSTATTSSTDYYAQVTTDSQGQAVVEFQTSVYTKTRSYSVKVENPNAPEKENFQVVQKVYSRTARPMINTPAATATSLPVTTPPTQAPVSTEPTLVPTPLPTTPVIPTTTPTPVKKTPVYPGMALGAAAIAMLALRRR